MCVREPRGLRGAEDSARPRCRRRARGARAPAHRHQPITQPGKKKKRKEKLARRRPGRSSQNSKPEPARGVGGRASSSSLGIPQSPGRRNRGINWDPSSSSSPAKPASLWLAAAGGGYRRRRAGQLRARRAVGRVKKTAGNRTGYRGYRCNRSGPVPVPGGSNRGKIQILNLNSRK